jgi:hypothetical protein
MQLFLELVPCLVVVTAAGVLLTLVLFAAIQRRVGKVAKAVINGEASRQAEASELTNQINELKRRIGELEKAEIPAYAESQSEGDLSSAARSMALKLRRAGQAPEEIAQKLRLSKGEVELLIKAQKIVMRPYEKAETAAAGGLKKG